MKHIIRTGMTAFIAGALLALPFGAGASAQSRTYDPIRCGLWAGVNLNVSQMTCGQNSGSQTTQRRTTTQSSSPVAAGSITYAALGDSVAAGLGLPLGNTPNAAQCSRSDQGYPNTVAARTGLSLLNVSCSGATAGDLVTKLSVSGPNIAAQLDQVYASGTPRLISITAGANDVHWADFIKACYAYNCGGSAYRAAATAYQSVLSAKLSYALSSIQTRSGGQAPTVLLTGYYNPLSNRCTTQQSNLTASEISWLSSETTRLNNTIRASAQTYSFARFIPISFNGHDICSSNPWVQGLSDPAPFHPTAVGQTKIADAVVNAYRQSSTN